MVALNPSDLPFLHPPTPPTTAAASPQLSRACAPRRREGGLSGLPWATQRPAGVTTGPLGPPGSAWGGSGDRGVARAPRAGRKRVRTRSGAGLRERRRHGACAEPPRRRPHPAQTPGAASVSLHPGRPGLAGRGARRRRGARLPARPPARHSSYSPPGPLTLRAASRAAQGGGETTATSARSPAGSSGAAGTSWPRRDDVTGRPCPPRGAPSQWMPPLGLRRPPPLPPTQLRGGVVGQPEAGRGRWPPGDKRRKTLPSSSLVLTPSL